nr:hypothetical protein [Tanacetum cinerariifolium]
MAQQQQIIPTDQLVTTKSLAINEMLIKRVLSSQRILLNHGRQCSRCSTTVLPQEHLDMIRQRSTFFISFMSWSIVFMLTMLLFYGGTFFTVLEEDYHSIKDDIPLVSVYTIRNVTVRGMLITDEFFTDDIGATEDYKEYEKVFVGKKRKRKQVAEEISSPKPSLKIRVKQMQPRTTPISTS